MFGPMGLFEEAKAPKAEEPKERRVVNEYSIMMTMFHKASVSHLLTGLQGLFVNHIEYLPVFSRKPDIARPVDTY